MRRCAVWVVLLGWLVVLAACDGDAGSAVSNNDANNGANNSANNSANNGPGDERPAAPEHDGIYSFANGCYRLDAVMPAERDDAGAPAFLVAADDGAGFAFAAAEEGDGARFFMKASDLGTYLFYDEGAHYFVVEDEAFLRKRELLSDILLLDDSYLPGAQWELRTSPHDATRFALRHLRSGHFLATAGLVEGAEHGAIVTLYPAEGCAEHPELSLDAEGEVEARTFEDGSLFGFVETHSHLMTNFGFGGGGIFHGAVFHPLGVQHALPSCEPFHGEGGRQDLFGYAYDNGDRVDAMTIMTALASGQTPEFFHHTEGYPQFTHWPSAHDSSTHQTQYYRWLQRAWMSGMRLLVNHATSNQIICDIAVGTGSQAVRYSCNDMVAIDRSLEETRRLERYIDAQEGGPGRGWFRIVESPAEAREVIAQGKLAVVLGIEVSNLFDCFLVVPGGGERCTREEVVEVLDRYHAKGVRALFPVHKYDNAFSAGDGHRDIIELGNFAQTGHHSNFTLDCPDQRAPFDWGGVTFGGLNQPRDDYHAAPPFDMSRFADDPMRTLMRHASMLTGGALHGDYCQNAGLTELGEFLIEEMMKRGMILELDHFNRRAYARAFEMITAHDYPAAGTHGHHNSGRLYELGGVSKFNFAPCSDPAVPGARAAGLRQRLALIEAAGGYPAEGLGFDLNGFAGAPAPRFGDKSPCTAPQANPVTYPFTSYAGDVVFTEPRVGERVLDFNTEGLAHIGLVAELIEDVRRDGVEDAVLEGLFRSAEGYLRMWERAEARGRAIVAGD